jgi:hypothetical protein
MGIRSTKSYAMKTKNQSYIFWIIGIVIFFAFIPILFTIFKVPAFENFPIFYAFSSIYSATILFICGILLLYLSKGSYKIIGIVLLVFSLLWEIGILWYANSSRF